ncbi:MAG TPA: NAD-binding protein [Thermodesulfobacteriota bacterium]|nr:NAD-binding protein [Thermodesulfobacteriota bacterium]
MSTHLSYFFRDRHVRRNIRALLKYLLFLAIVITIYSIVFHLIMLYVERQYHSWITGLYWTLTTMSTLGFGDITFTSDVGRLFSVVVLLSGIVLLLIVLPFAFIRYFYAPWLEAQIRLRAPRNVPEETSGHVVICNHDTMTSELIKRLNVNNIPYFVIESDPTIAASMYEDGISVVTGEVDSRTTYENLLVSNARMVLANRDDTVNTNIILTVREVAPDVPIVSIANYEDSIDILELSGSTHVLPLKKWLGEQLANRVNTTHAQSHVIGSFKDLLIAELPVHNTPLENRTIRETRLREITGISIVAVWERGVLLPVRPDTKLSDISVLTIIGTEAQLQKLDGWMTTYNVNPNLILIIGGGKVGRAASRALKRKGLRVNLIERNEALRERIGDIPDQVFIGDAADHMLLMRAGLKEVPSVLLTTNDDAMNIYLASYCRHLNPELRIVSRITHDRNIEAIHRAGADLVLSSDSLGASAIISLLQGKELCVLGEGFDLFYVSLPKSLEGKKLAESDIGAHTGLNVIAVQQDGNLITNPSPSTTLLPGSELVMLGNIQQRQEFAELFEKSR